MISYLVAQALGGNDGDLIADTLVGVEVKGEAGVVAFFRKSAKILDRWFFVRQKGVLTLNDDLGGLLDGLNKPEKAVHQLLTHLRFEKVNKPLPWS